MSKEIENIIDSLSPIERKIVPFLSLPIEEIEQKSQLDSVSVLRALKFLENKSVIKLQTKIKNLIDLGTNGIYYKKNHLPERKLLLTLEANNHISLEEAQKLSKLSENEFKVSLGVLKSKALVELKNGKLSLNASKIELSKKSFLEQFLEILPIEESKLSPEQQFAYQNLKKRKEIVELKEEKTISIELTDLGKQLAGREIKSDLIEDVSAQTIRDWNRNKKFRKYDIKSPVPAIYGGKKHFVNQAIEYGKRIWLDLGFQEMPGPLVDSSFWIFDSLFTPQDHPAREMQDTFFIKNISGKLPDKEIVSNVRKVHESGLPNSKGWNYSWKEDIARTSVLRTHTTGLSARTLSKLNLKELPAKYFAIGKVFRNETVDWSHGFEFYQTEGIVIDEYANFRNLLGYLKEFYQKMGFSNIRFRPSFFAYTEPSVEIEVFHPEKKIWIELGGAGIFRPEVTIPLLGKPIPVLAWGQGFDRIIMDFYKIQDLREMYSNNLKSLREKKAWIK